MALLKIKVVHEPPVTMLQFYMPVPDEVGVRDIPLGVLTVLSWTWSVLRTKCFDNPSIEVVE